MPAKLDVLGEQFGRLKVVEKAKPFGRRSAWKCICECGNSTRVRTEHLRGNRVNSCGCIRQETAAALKFDHGHARKGKTTAEFNSWIGMRERCFNPNAEKYPTYGARGITVCDEWRNDFSAFLAHVGLKPNPRMTIDRIDNDGNYEPGNVRWATPHEQRMNQRRMKSKLYEDG